MAANAGQSRRLAHLMSEQKRRESINTGFTALRHSIPNVTQNDSKAIILRKAVNHISYLETILHDSGIPFTNGTPLPSMAYDSYNRGPAQESRGSHSSHATVVRRSYDADHARNHKQVINRPSPSQSDSISPPRRNGSQVKPPPGPGPGSRRIWEDEDVNMEGSAEGRSEGREVNSQDDEEEDEGDDGQAEGEEEEEHEEGEDELEEEEDVKPRGMDALRVGGVASSLRGG